MRTLINARLVLWFVITELLLMSVATGASADEIYLRVNQVGYRPEDLKSAIAFSSASLPESFAVLDEATLKMVHEGKPVLLAGARWGKFENHAELDFSAVTRPGRYRLEMAGSKTLPSLLARKFMANCRMNCLNSYASNAAVIIRFWTLCATHSTAAPLMDR
jgi:hypothetical protein